MRIRNQRGVSIVEALVALVVLSIGMLGIASMYLESMRANRTALARTAAIQLVNDMGDRIRANRTARGDYTAALGTPPSAPSKDCTAVECTPTQIAQYDLSQWYTSVKNTLPKGADGSIPQVAVAFIAGTSAADPARYTVRAAWKETGDDNYVSTQVEVLLIGGST
jgi:type IV pilus assembly protein PilV